MKKKKVLIGLFLMFIFLAFVSANFELGNQSTSVETIYGPGDNLTGWINISLNNEAADSIFSDSSGNTISLIDLINQNTNFNYNCSNINCTYDYSKANEQDAKSFNLNVGESKLIGFKFSGEITSINSIDFVVDSDASADCYNQIKIDFLNDGIVDTGNNKLSGSSCSFLKSYGCFDKDETAVYIDINQVPYCEKVNVFESPGLKIGAWVSEETPGDKELSMGLYSLSGNYIDACTLNKQGLSNASEVSCNIDYQVTNPEDYYVCIYSNAGTGTYKTEGYSNGLACGFSGFPNQTETSAYHIFAEGRAFADVGTLNISDTLPSGNTLSNLAQNYLSTKYNGLNCSQDCIVPIKITSGKNQQITLRNLNVEYNKPGLTGIIENNFYDLNSVSSMINSDFQKLFLDKGGFLLPTDYGELDFELKLNNQTILQKTLSIQEVPLISSITPKTTAAAYPTLFKANINSSNQLVNYRWDFGDNITQTTTINQVTHTYNALGDYNLKVIITDSLGRNVSKTILVNVGSAKQIINSTLFKKSSDLDKIDLEIKRLDLFTQNSIKSLIDVSDLKITLNQLLREYNAASSEEEYNQILTSLLDLDIPNSIVVTKNANLFLSLPKKEYIYLPVLETIAGGNYDLEDEDKYINAIISWNQENFETRISFKEISAGYPSFNRPLVNIFELNLKAKESLSSNPYFIMPSLEGLSFKENYLENEESGYTYIELKQDEQTIGFSTTENIDFSDVPFFVSPGINKLTIDKTNQIQEEPPFRWMLFISIVILLLFIGIISYMILAIWYKNKYESHLFKNRNNLYNLVVYIENSRKKGLKDKEISSKLKKAGWNSEQISYALKKHAGKRTGMFEISISKIFRKFKNKAPQQKKGIDNKKRFIR